MLNPYIDTAIGVAVIYLVFSIMAYVIQEFWAAFRESRGRMLRKALYDLLNDNLNKGYGTLLFIHPQFDFLKKNENTLPAYLPASNFATALIDLIGKEATEMQFIQSKDGNTTVKSNLAIPATEEDMFNRFKSGLESMNNSNLKTLLQNILVQSNNLSALKINLENWYNEYMDRVTGWYKRKAAFNLRWIGVTLAVIFNIQAFYIITTIYSDRQMRDKLVSLGERMVDQPQAITDIYSSSFQTSLQDLNKVCEQRLSKDSTDSGRAATLKDCETKRLALADSFALKRKQQFSSFNDSLRIWNLPIGWNLLKQRGTPAEAAGSTSPTLSKNWWYWVLGWLISGLAISAGAPFWFQLLNRLVNIRRTGLRPASSPQTDKQKN